MNRTAIWIACALALTALMSCQLGSPTGGGGTEGEGVVAGVLVAPDGSPVVGALVRAYTVAPLAKSGAGTAAPDPVDSATTAPDGSFSLPRLSTGTYNIAATVTRNDSALAAFIPGVVVNGTALVGVDTVRGTGSLTLQVRDADAPLANSECALPASPWSAVSGTAGLCVLDALPPGEFRITVSHPSFGTKLSAPLTVSTGGATEAALNLAEANGEQPSAPALLDPAAGAVEVPVSGSLAWRSAAGATHYHVQLAPDSLFESVRLRDSTLTDTTRNYAALEHGMPYWWRVRAIGPGGTSMWSERRAFATVGTDDPPQAPPAGPGDRVPVPIAPAAHAVDIPSPTMLVWSPVGQGTLYRVQVASDTLFATRVVDTTTTDSTLGLSGLQPSTGYFWRVRAEFTGTPGAWSPTHPFMRAPATQAHARPQLSMPLPNAVNVSTTPTLSWTDNGGDSGTFYVITITTDTGFTAPILVDSVPASGQSVHSREVGPLPAGTYYWKVTAEDPDTSRTSDLRRFTTHGGGAPPVATPHRVAPVNGATGVSLHPVFRWRAMAGAASYHLQVSIDTNFTSGILLEDSLLTDTSMTPSTALADSAIHYWRVRVRAGSYGAGLWSTIGFFSTLPVDSSMPPSGPDAAVPLSPADSAIGISTAPTLSWNAASGAIWYQLQVTPDPSFTQLTVNDSLQSTSAQAGPLASGTHYWWRVWSHSAEGSKVSLTRRFLTAP